MKKFIGLAAVAAFSSIMVSSAWAGTWKQNNVGWWFDNGNGTYPASTWQWIDGNNDGIAECYYFDCAGYMLANTSTPDGYQVNASGAWVQNGAVQTKNLRANSQTTSSRPKLVLFDVNPTYETSGIVKEKTMTVTDGGTWTDVIRIWDNRMVEFTNGKGYNRLKATVATEYDSSDNGKVGELIVYGDAGNVIYRSGNIVGDETGPFDIDVDISGQSKVQIVFSTKETWYAIGLKSARFE